MDLKELVYELNPHWEENYYYGYEKKRKIFKKLEKELDNSLITSLYGPRRVGKSITILQLIDSLIKRGVKRERILYFSFDIHKENLLDVFKAFRELFSHNIRNGRFYVFFDEIQKVKNWNEEIKHLYDAYWRNVKFFISGSSSLRIKKGKESLAGRINSFLLNVLDFEEYLHFKGKKAKLDFDSYLYRQLPYLALNNADVSSYIKELVNKYLAVDMGEEVRDVHALESLFRVIVKQPGQIIKISDLSDELGINRNTLSNYLALLEDSLLIRKLYNFSRNARKSEVRAKKYYPFYPNLCAYVLPYAVETPLLYETYIANITNAEYFYYDREEIDFIVGDDLSIGIESKAKNVIKEKDIRLLIKNPLSLKKRIVVHKRNSRILVDKGGISFVPIESFNMQIL